MRVGALWRYPVKGLRGHAVGSASVEAVGLAGDRRWLVIDEDGRFLTQREVRAMAQVDVALSDDGVVLGHDVHGRQAVPVPGPAADVVAVTVWRDAVPARLADGGAARYLSTVLGRSVRLAYMADPGVRPVNPEFGHATDRVSFADGYPILVTTMASLADLSRRLGADITMRRFRPNLVIEGAEPWAEDAWRRIRIGGVELRVVKPCERCVVTTLDPDTGAQPDPAEPLRTLGRFHRSSTGKIIFGQNAIPDTLGRIAVGDPVEVLESGLSSLA